MSKYRHALQPLMDRPFLTDGGLETTLIFHEGIELPMFAAFDLLRTEAGTAQLRRYYARYAELAREQGLGLVLETPTWRANPDWGKSLGYDAKGLASANRRAIELMLGIRAQYESTQCPMPISGNLGPRGDGYVPGQRMSMAEAAVYHHPQIRVFADTAADLVSAFTMNYVEEAIGIAMAARDCDMPVVISFTLETDGNLPSGDSLAQAIERVDAETAGYPVYYMINCAHPTHFERVFSEAAAWHHRIRGLRTNASMRSHAELDSCSDLDDGNPDELGLQHRRLKSMLPQLTVLGGCCGTDHRHVEAICRAAFA
ncbi:MAG TPA: homocysteine S-methyltransferase family protein [Xanthomonadaceae bacterium]|nr:homocysteine S-methyltransferase family protein [Xanthomonadaceae bacterium]